MTFSRRQFVAGLLSLPLAGVHGSGRAQPAPLKSIRLNIPGPGAMPFTPVELISRLGMDRALGAELLIRYFPSGVQGVEDLLAGNADFAGLGFAVLPKLLAKGQNVVAIAPLSGATPPFSVIVHASLRGKLRSIADLKGHSVGVSVGSAKAKSYLQSMAELLLASGGVQPDQVRWVGTAQNVEAQLVPWPAGWSMRCSARNLSPAPWCGWTTGSCWRTCAMPGWRRACRGRGICVP